MLFLLKHNPYHIDGDSSYDSSPIESGKDSRFNAVERQRCKVGHCKKGFIVGHADDPDINGGGVAPDGLNTRKQQPEYIDRNSQQQQMGMVPQGLRGNA